jgi:hypothetical protein
MRLAPPPWTRHAMKSAIRILKVSMVRGQSPARQATVMDSSFVQTADFTGLGQTREAGAVNPCGSTPGISPPGSKGFSSVRQHCAYYLDTLKHVTPNDVNQLHPVRAEARRFLSCDTGFRPCSVSKL